MTIRTATVEGVWRAGYQEHAYLETNGCLAIPEPDGGGTVLTMTKAVRSRREGY